MIPTSVFTSSNNVLGICLYEKCLVSALAAGTVANISQCRAQFCFTLNSPKLCGLSSRPSHTCKELG